MSDHDTKNDEASSEKVDDTDAVGVEEAGFDSKNNSRDEREAIMEADSPDDVDKDLLEEIESERRERLDPDNRPENAQVDNTKRTFIAEEARFEDTELSEEEKNDGIGQKQPDPETQAGSADSDTDTDTDTDRDTDSDTDRETAGEQHTAESGSPTGGSTAYQPSQPGKHKA